MIWVFFLVVAVGLLGVFAGLLTGRFGYDPMSEPVASQSDPGLPEAPHARDVDGLRFDRALRGYRMDQVDEVLDGLRDTLARQEDTIAALRRGEEPGPDPEAAPGSPADAGFAQDDAGAGHPGLHEAAADPVPDPPPGTDADPSYQPVRGPDRAE